MSITAPILNVPEVSTLGFFMPVSIVAALSAATQRSFEDPVNTSIPLIFSSPGVQLLKRSEIVNGEREKKRRGLGFGSFPSPFQSADTIALISLSVAPFNK